MLAGCWEPTALPPPPNLLLHFIASRFMSACTTSCLPIRPPPHPVLLVLCFQTYKHAVVEPGPKLNLVLGPNGAAALQRLCPSLGSQGHTHH